jgi:hypothetical protein
MEQSGMLRRRGKPKNSERNQHHRHFVHHETDFDHPELNPYIRGVNPVSSHLSYDTTIVLHLPQKFTNAIEAYRPH